MKLPEDIINIIEGAESKVLATLGPDGPNAIPLSMVIVDGEKIVVCDCFMGKTAKNLSADSRAAMSFWKGFAGVQVKGQVAYETAGETFDRYVAWLKGKHPDRTLRGVIVMTPEHVYDLAPSNAGAKLV